MTLHDILCGVFDQGIREWVIAKYTRFYRERNSSQFAAYCTMTAADIVFGAGTWRICETSTK